jgi:hypothetical protein
VLSQQSANDVNGYRFVWTSRPVTKQVNHALQDFLANVPWMITVYSESMRSVWWLEFPQLDTIAQVSTPEIDPESMRHDDASPQRSCRLHDIWYETCKNCCLEAGAEVNQGSTGIIILLDCPMVQLWLMQPQPLQRCVYQTGQGSSRKLHDDLLHHDQVLASSNLHRIEADSVDISLK